jgi:phospholipid/cholesterol/gamma-HCH transport system substrate-binding protein
MVGTLALAGAAVLLVSLVGLSPLGPGGQSLRACFDDVGGLESGDPVYLRGVHVGRVSRMELDADYRPCATLDVDASLRLADDTSAVILTKGVLGDRCVDLEPGGSDTPLRDGDEIDYTQSAMVLERMVGRVLMDLQDQR